MRNNYDFCLKLKVCIIIYCLFMPNHVVAFPEKFLKIIATRSTIFSLKFTKNCLWPGSARTRCGSLSAPPNTLEGKGGKEMEREGGKEKGKEWRGEEGEWVHSVPVLFRLGLYHCLLC